MLKTLIIVVLVIALLAGAYLFFTSGGGSIGSLTGGTTVSNQNVSYSDNVSLQTKSQNAGLLAALYSGGIQDALVDINSERVYVAYELPNGTDSDTMQRFVIGASADAAPNSSTIIALQYVNNTPSTIWTVSMDNFKAYVNGNLTLDEFEAKIGKKTY